MSFLLGSVVGLICTIFLKWMKYFELNRTQETSIIIFFAYIAYTLTEELGFSPIIAVLFCGIFMSHYAFYNLSFQSREESSVVAYLGLTMMNYFKKNISISFICWELLFVILGRTFSIFGVACIMK
jgi:NhaP-type Na+/H+ or K+/H+ antiporter